MACKRKTRKRHRKGGHVDGYAPSEAELAANRYSIPTHVYRQYVRDYNNYGWRFSDASGDGVRGPRTDDMSLNQFILRRIAQDREQEQRDRERRRLAAIRERAYRVRNFLPDNVEPQNATLQQVLDAERRQQNERRRQAEERRRAAQEIKYFNPNIEEGRALPDEQQPCKICYDDEKPLINEGKTELNKRIRKCLTCKNLFHLNCLSRWFYTQYCDGREPNCPICRTRWPSQEDVRFLKRAYEENKEEEQDIPVQGNRSLAGRFCRFLSNRGRRNRNRTFFGRTRRRRNNAIVPIGGPLDPITGGRRKTRKRKNKRKRTRRVKRIRKRRRKKSKKVRRK